MGPIREERLLTISNDKDMYDSFGIILPYILQIQHTALQRKY